MTRTIAQLWRLLDPAEKTRSAWLAALMLVSGAIEVSGVLSVVPLVAVLTSADDPCGKLGQTAGAACASLLPSRNPYVLAFLALGLIALSNLLAFCVTWFSARLTWAVWQRIAVCALGAYLGKPYEYFFSAHSSAIVKNIVYETERLSASLLMPLLIVAARVVVAVAVALLVLAVDPVLALVSFMALAGVYLAVYRRLQGRIRRSGDLAFQARERISRITTETIAGIRELRMLDCGPHFSDNFGQAARALAEQYEYAVKVSVLPRYLIETAAFAAVLVLALYLSGGAGGWQAAAPLLGFYLFAAYRLLPQLQQIFANAIIVQQNSAVAATLAELLAQPTTGSPPAATLTALAAQLQPPISLHGVTYQYPGTAKPVVEQADMQIPRRSTVGLVGATGAGKSTVIDLIAGLIEPAAGEIRLNGTRLTGELAPAWRSRIGYVPQTLFLLDDTISRNIAFGVGDEAISQAQVERAAGAANIHDFIAGLPQGYDTVVGERGVRLSGGQRQRLVIARALYRDPEVLIFDEATSALDQETEQAVLEAIRSLSHRKTLLIISHRPATLRDCDLVYEVADGKIAARR